MTTAGKTTKVKLTTPYQVPTDRPARRHRGRVRRTGRVQRSDRRLRLPDLPRRLVVRGHRRQAAVPDPLFLADGHLGDRRLLHRLPVRERHRRAGGDSSTSRAARPRSLTFDVPYQVLGAVTGSIKISGLPVRRPPDRVLRLRLPDRERRSTRSSSCPACTSTRVRPACYSVRGRGPAALRPVGAPRQAARGRGDQAQLHRPTHADRRAVGPHGQLLDPYGTFYPEQAVTVNVTAGGDHQGEAHRPLRGTVPRAW